MEEIILSSLFWKQIQLSFMAMCLLVATCLSVWILPWSDMEFDQMIFDLQKSPERIRQKLQMWRFKTVVKRDELIK